MPSCVRSIPRQVEPSQLGPIFNRVGLDLSRVKSSRVEFNYDQVVSSSVKTRSSRVQSDPGEIKLFT